jgi:hypothetical protein
VKFTKHKTAVSPSVVMGTILTQSEGETHTSHWKQVTIVSSKFWSSDLKGRDILKDLAVDGRIVYWDISYFIHLLTCL